MDDVNGCFIQGFDCVTLLICCLFFVVSFFNLLQHKKLAEGSAYEEVSTSTPYSENDISNSIKNGLLYLEDPINHVSSVTVYNWIACWGMDAAWGSMSSLRWLFCVLSLLLGFSFSFFSISYSANTVTSSHLFLQCIDLINFFSRSLREDLSTLGHFLMQNRHSLNI